MAFGTATLYSHSVLMLRLLFFDCEHFFVVRYSPSHYTADTVQTEHLWWMKPLST